MKTGPFLFFLGCLSLVSCTSGQETDNSSKAYFDLKGFFENESLQLQKKNPQVNKTVSQNSEIQSKVLHIGNWQRELDLFTGSDINKPAWNKSYQLKTAGAQTSYNALDSNLKTRKIIIDRSPQGKITHIYILNQLNNSLYTSSEELNYYPDSLYTIRKKQDVLILGNNDYLITGHFNPGN